MVRHRLSVEEAKALMIDDPEHANRLIFYAIVFLSIIAACIIAFIYTVVT